jgi:hypothetical protein
MITLGTYIENSADDSAPKITTEVPELRRHIRTPWCRAYIEKNLGVSLTGNGSRPTGVATVDAQQLSRHTLVCGGTGSGKSRLIEHVVIEQIRQGCSAVVLDPKAETVDHLLGHLQNLGYPAGQITVVSPRYPEAVPGWNPFLAGVPLNQAASDFVSVLERSTSAWGPRMQDLLTNAILVVGTHRLSLFELTRLLLREDYRENLLKTPVHGKDVMAYEEARTYFLEEFGTWSRSERSQAVAPVLNKLREILRSQYLRPMLCARRNTIDLAKLWHRPHVVLVHLDRTTLGDEGVRLLAGLLTNLLFRTALRERGKVPVVLALDELATVEHFVGAALADVVTVARSQNLRLLVACQHLSQLSDGLRSALLGNAAVQTFFRLGHADARLVAASLSAQSKPRIARVEVRSEGRDRYTGETAKAEWSHPIRDPHGRPLRMDNAAWGRLYRVPNYYNNPVAALRQLAPSLGVHRLYVHAADSKEPVELGRYVTDVSNGECRITGPAPLELVVQFPGPRINRIERTTESEVSRAWIGVLQDLAVQSAVVRIAGHPTGVVKIVDVPLPPGLSDGKEYIRASARANAQAVEEIGAVFQWRKNNVERIAGGHLSVSQNQAKEEDDGSIA